MNMPEQDQISSVENAVDDSAFLELYRQNEQGTPLGWGPSPLDINDEIVDQQRNVHDELSRLFRPEALPDYVSPALARYIEDLNMARTAHRERLNHDSYCYRRDYRHEGVPLEALDILARAQTGNAAPAELLYIRRVLGIPTIELSSLTHPYGGERIKNYLAPMRRANTQAIVMHGGRLCEETPIYEVKGRSAIHYDVDEDGQHIPDEQRHYDGVHMTRKTKVGILPDGTAVIERSSFVINLNSLPSEYRDAIRAVPFMNNENWARQVRRANKFYEYVPQLLEDNDFEKAIPISTTVVAMNESDMEVCLSETATRARRLEIMADAIARRSTII